MKLLLAGFSVRGFAELAAASSFKADIFALDSFCDTDLTLLGIPAAKIEDTTLLNSALMDGFDGLLYTSGLEHDPDRLEKLAAGKRIFGNKPETLRRLRNTKEFYAFLKNEGILFPETLFAGDSVPNTGTWLIKPLYKDGGQGIFRVENGRAIPDRYVAQVVAEGPFSRMT